MLCAYRSRRSLLLFHLCWLSFTRTLIAETPDSSKEFPISRGDPREIRSAAEKKVHLLLSRLYTVSLLYVPIIGMARKKCHPNKSSLRQRSVIEGRGITERSQVPFASPRQIYPSRRSRHSSIIESTCKRSRRGRYLPLARPAFAVSTSRSTSCVTHSCEPENSVFIGSTQRIS